MCATPNVAVLNFAAFRPEKKKMNELFCKFNIYFKLQSLYESIKTEPFKIPEDDGNDLMHTFFNPDKEGWLWKQGRVFR